MITRVVAVNNLSLHKGVDLAQVAIELGITTFKEGKQNKGWKGIVLERLAGLSNNSKQAPNGLGFELKSSSFYMKNGVWVPKETFAITMINQDRLIATPFYESHCWEKLKSLIYCAVSWHGKHVEKSILIKVQSFDFLENSDVLNEIEADYEFIRKKLINNGYSALTGSDGKWIQARTKGAGHGSTSRAFYARKELISKIISITDY